MSTYLVEIIRDSLADFVGRVADEEAGASEFVDNRIATLDNQLVNLATFRELAPGQVPQPPTFAELGHGPAGQMPVWTGVVMIGSKNLAVSLFRSPEGGTP